VSGPKTINIKQYFNTNNFSSNLHNFILQKYFIKNSVVISHKKSFFVTTPLHQAARRGYTEVTKVLLEAGASLSAVDNDVIKPSVKLRQSNNKFFK
jgi:ankyrin repeat protein